MYYNIRRNLKRCISKHIHALSRGQKIKIEGKRIPTPIKVTAKTICYGHYPSVSQQKILEVTRRRQKDKKIILEASYTSNFQFFTVKSTKLTSYRSRTKRSYRGASF